MRDKPGLARRCRGQENPRDQALVVIGSARGSLSNIKDKVSFERAILEIEDRLEELEYLSREYMSRSWQVAGSTDNGTKRRHVEEVLRDPVHGLWSDRRIAAHVGCVSHTFVANLRRRLFPDDLPATTGLDGRTRRHPRPRAS